MTKEMCVLMEEMDNLLKEKSDNERNATLSKKRMENILIEYKEIIKNLQKELKAS